jgi:hypothetical protein
MNVFPMALANAPGLRESQLRGIVCNGLLPHANLLFSCASRAAIEGKVMREKRKDAKSAPLATRALKEAMLNAEDFEMGASGRLASPCCRQLAS